MQHICLPKNLYKLYDYARPQEFLDVHRKRYEAPVRSWEKLKKSGVSDAIASEFSGISRATYYRHKKVLKQLGKGIAPPTRRPKTFRKTGFGDDIRALVLQIRRENPTYGKAKIAPILCRDHGLAISESTVGRILKNLKESGKITVSASAPRVKRTRRFNNTHAKRWAYNMRPKIPGDMVQIDHMTVSKNSLKIKHFQAWDPITRTIVADARSEAKSITAARFLKKVIAEMPFKINSIQVDGGSEFMKDFEEACQKEGIALYVLPPKRPQYNGGVERANRIFREEFYNQKSFNANSLGEARAMLKKAVEKYNNYRPHSALDGMTPNAYTQQILRAA